MDNKKNLPTTSDSFGCLFILADLTLALVILSTDDSV